MRKLFHPLWATLTFIITITFIITFYNIITGYYGVLKSIIFTATGASVIWLVFHIRNNTFSRILATFEDEEE